MTRAKYNKNPKLTSEQWILFFKQQTIQVALLMEALDQAYEKIRSLEAQKNKREEEDADEYSVTLCSNTGLFSVLRAPPY